MKRQFSEKKPHIVFIYPPANSSPDESFRTFFQMCLGSAYIISYLKENGIPAKQYLTNKPVNLSECVKQILFENPDIIGFTVDNSNYSLSVLLADAIKRVNRKIIIVFGGLIPSIHSETILKRNRSVDICVRNEGEETFLQIISQLIENKFDLKNIPFKSILGISFREANDVISTSDRLCITGHKNDYLDKYPSPYLTGIIKSHKLGIITARGCNQYCAFCASALMSKRKILTHSIDRVIEELDYISKYLIPNKNAIVDIFDDTFTLIPERAMVICNKIIENKIDLNLAGITRCDKVDEELLDRMKEAGFKELEFSLESAVPRLLRIIGKVSDPDTEEDKNFDKEKTFIDNFKKYIKYAKKIGIEKVYGSVIVGIPSETPKEARQTINFIDSLKNELELYAHNAFSAYPGTSIFSKCKSYGIKLAKQKNEIHYDTIHTYNTNIIKPASKSSLEVSGLSRDRDNIKTLSFILSKKRENNPGFFNKIILDSNLISDELVLWINKYLALNGVIIQLYSSLKTVKEYLKKNDNILKEKIFLTAYYTAYYKKREKNFTSLIPARTINYGKKCGISIKLLNADSKKDLLVETDPSVSIYLEKNKEDTGFIYNILKDISQRKKNGETIFDFSPLPYINNLCRWENSYKNCKSLETLIIDKNYEIKTCWNGESIGKVGDSLKKIIKNLSQKQIEYKERRGCSECIRVSECSKCVFPGPYNEDKFCEYKKKFDSVNSADIIRSLEFFKEFANG